MHTIVIEGRRGLYMMGGMRIKSHQVCTDDIIFSGCASHKNFRALVDILNSSLCTQVRNKTTIKVSPYSQGKWTIKLAGFPMKHLRVLVTENSIAHRNCDFLIADLWAFLDRGSMQALSYNNQMQLVQWVFHKFNYLMQSSNMPSHTIDAIWLITYLFVWST